MPANVDLESLVDEAAREVGASGVVRVDVDHRVVCQRAYGMAHRGLAVANNVDTQFAIASGTKGLTALAVVSLIEEGQLDFDTTARSVLGADLALIDDGVTVEHLLTHRSGIGDYLDEDEDPDLNDYLMAVPVHELATTEQYVRVLDGHLMKFAPGERFSYSNGGYVVLALIAERVSGVPFHDLVHERVCVPAGMVDTAFLRSDELPSRAAVGYLGSDGLRTNVFHLPVRGNGDGGVYTTADDVHALWDAFLAGRIVPPERVTQMVAPSSDESSNDLRYGLGFWLDESTGTISLHGFDAGVGFVSACDATGDFAYTVITNAGRGAWPLSQRIGALLQR